MKDSRCVVLGGAGFVGAALARALKKRFPHDRIVAIDNLKRRGSEFNLPLLKEAGVTFIHGDVRQVEDLDAAGEAEWWLDCSAEPSVLAGANDPRYLIQTNLQGTLNALECARKQAAKFIFLSTSRVYPIGLLESMPFRETETRFEWTEQTGRAGVSPRGVSESCPVEGVRSLYGATKLASEYFIQEYGAAFGLEYLINRFGVIAGPGQFGKSDQGVFTYWLLSHWKGRPLKYIGYGGTGKQVRDLLHIDDLVDLVLLEIERWRQVSNHLFCAGGGRAVSASLLETTHLCQEITGRSVSLTPILENRPNDLRIYLTDHSAVTGATGWHPRRDTRTILTDTFRWMNENEKLAESLI